MKNRKTSTRTIAVVAIMSALAFVFMLLEFSLPFVPSFLKFDFSDLPAFLVSFAISPVAGVIVELLKNLLHLPFTATSGVGELANFIIGAAYVLPAGFIYKNRRNRKNAILGSIAGTLTASLISLPVNYFITYPFYFNFMPQEGVIGMYKALFPWVDSLITALLTVNLPFTAVKGAISVVITFVIYKPLSPVLKGKSRKKT